MSSSEDEFEVAVGSRKPKPRPKQTALKPSSSSTKPATKTKSGQKKFVPPSRAHAQTVEMDDEDDDVELLDNDDDDAARSTVQKPQAKKTNTDKVTTKAKGKAKTEPKGATSVSKANGANGKGRTTEDEDTDGYEDIRPIPRVAPLPPITAHKPTVSNNSLVKEIERLKKQLTAVSAERDAAMQKFKELAQLRQTDVEAPLEAMRMEREEASRTQNQLLTLLKSDYTKSLLLPVKRGAIAELITLDQAEEQRQDLLARSKAKDERILELQKQLENNVTQDRKWAEELEKKNKELERDLSEEIRNSKRLMDQLSKRPGGPGALKTSASRVTDGQLEKWNLIKAFYQDMTGLLVQDVKEVIGSKNERTETYSCLLATPATAEPHRELAFALSMYGGQTSGVPDEHVIYTPKDLDKAPDGDFLEAIDYLKDPFTFPRSQMQVFFNNLLEVLKGTQNPEEEDEDDGMEE